MEQLVKQQYWNAYFFGRRPVYLVFCSAYRCSRQMPRRIKGTLCEVHAALDGTFGGPWFWREERARNIWRFSPSWLLFIICGWDMRSKIEKEEDSCWPYGYIFEGFVPIKGTTEIKKLTANQDTYSSICTIKLTWKLSSLVKSGSWHDVINLVLS